VKVLRFKLASLIKVITVLLIGLLLLMPVIILYWSSYYAIYTGVLFSALLVLLVAAFYHNYGDRETRARLRNLIGSLFGREKAEELLFKVRVVPLMHLLILFILAPPTLFIFYWLSRIEFNWVLVIVNSFFWGQMFLVALLSVLFSRLYVYKWGIRFRLNLMSFDNVSRVRLKWGGRLLVINRHGVNWLVEQHWYLLSDSLGFVKVLKSQRPEFQIMYE